MKTKQLTRILVPIVLAFVLVISGLTMLFATKGNASASVTDAIASFESEYAVGTEIDVPDAYFTVGGSQVKATKVVYSPDGTSYSVNKFTPTVMGKYAVEYFLMTEGGEYLSETANFYVYNNLYEVVGKANRASYGAHPLTPNTSGIMVAINATGEFKFNQVIDLEKLNGTSPFISMYMTPETVQEMDAQEFTIKLTDIYDDSNYVRIKVTSTQDGRKYGHNVAYIQAGAAFQPTTGYEKAWNRLHQNNIYGFGQNFSFFGCDSTGETSEQFLTAKNAYGQLQLFLDHDSKKVMTQGSSTGDREIIDLDNPAHFSELWDGFTTGEVFLSITTKGLKKSHLNFVITDIGGIDLTETKLVDSSAPYVSIDTLGYDENDLPRAVVGQPYPVFSATAVDPYSGENEAKVKVYQNYGSPAQSTVSVVDGKFTPNAPGDYYVVYSATDYSGNVGEVVHVVSCDETGVDISINVDTENRVVASNVGEIITLPDATTTGGSGFVTVTPFVTDASGKAVEITNGTYQPLSNGSYTVEFVATDYAGTKKTYSYEHVVTLSKKPVFETGASIPKYFIADTEYVIPELKAYDFYNGKLEQNVSIVVTDDDGERTLGADRKVTFKVNEVGATKDMTIKYVSSNANGTTEKSYTVKVINVKKIAESGRAILDTSKYFYSEDVTVSATETDVELISNQNGTVEFINPLSAFGFALNFFTVNAGNSLGKLNVVLEDGENADKKLVVGLFKNNSGATNTLINGAGPYEIAVNYNNGEFNLGYDILTKKITIDGTNYLTVNTWADGSEFDGFASNKVRMYIEFEDVTGKATVKVRRLNTQELNSGVLFDRVNPRIYAPSDGTRMRKINEIVTVRSAVACDVLDPNVSLTVRVTDKGGNVITSVDGIALNNVPADREYQFVLNKYGEYRINYSTEDDNGNKSGTPVLLNVVDPEAPVITLTQNNPTSVKKGTKVGLANFIAVDNSTSEENLTLCCFVVRPCGLIFTVNMKDSNSFVANETGTYVLRYFACDERGNATFVDYELTVTE